MVPEARHVEAELVPGKTDSIHHELLEAIHETATVLELRQTLLYTTPSGWWWWWCLKSVFREPVAVVVHGERVEALAAPLVASVLGSKYV